MVVGGCGSGNIKMKIPDVFTTCKLFAEGLYCAVE